MLDLKKIEKKCCINKSYLLVLALFLFAATFSKAKENSISAKISERGADKAGFTISTENKGRDAIIILRKSNIDPALPDPNMEYVPVTDISELSDVNITGEGNAVIHKGALNSEQFIVSNLEHNTDYALDLYYIADEGKIDLDKSILFSTLAKEPEKQTNGIIASIPDGGRVAVMISEKGDGNKRYLLVGENKEPAMPEDGIIFNTTTDIRSAAQINEHTYIIDSDRDYRFDVENLKSSTDYYFTVIEANGKEEKVNYLTTVANNTDKVKTPPAPPINLMVTVDNRKRLKAVWEKPEGAKKYQIDLATDPDFENKLNLYSGILIDNIDEYTFIGLDKDKYYYLRMRSVDDNGYSAYTDTLKAKINSL